MQNLNTGEIRIGASDTVCKYLLIPFLEKFNKQYPDIKIQVINRTSSQINEILKNGFVDLGIVTLPVEDKSLDVDELTEVEDIFVASNKYVQLKGAQLSLQELSVYPLLLLEKSSITRNNLDKFFKQNGLEITPEIELESNDLLVEFARIGLGIACVLKESAMPGMEKGELFQIQTDKKLPSRKLGIITLKNVPLSRAGTKFIEVLKGNC